MLSRDDPTVRALSATHLVAYLRANGWTAVPHPNPRVNVFRGPDGAVTEGMELAFPTSDRFRDFYDRAADVVQSLADALHMGGDEMARIIAQGTRAVLQARVFSLGADELDSVSLNVASTCLQHLRAAMAFTAMQESQPRPFFPKTTRVGSQFAHDCRFAHTRRGSFGFVVETPPSFASFADQSDGGVTSRPGFTRRVVQRLVTGLEAINIAADTDADSGDQVLKLSEQYNVGLNANVFEAIDGLAQQAEGTAVELTVSLGAAASAQSIKRHVSVTLTEHTLGVVRSAADVLRKVAEPVSRWYTCQVLNLETSFAPPQDVNRRTSILVYVREANARARVQVAPEDYLAAIEANLSNSLVYLFGTLVKRRKLYRLDIELPLIKTPPSPDKS